ncbi:uncharacterized protein JCM6883_001754 [Sporobolomyces salmoneus]|uniref:uncharacterized protein n=1 Tax=Sporobolomyces salmoneus TaxID=183962 RepID=UPI00317FEB07
MLRLFSLFLLGAAIAINYYFSSSRIMPHQTNERTQFYLFGSPIQHSLSPAFHNTLFEALSLPNHSYSLHERPTFSSDASTLSLLRDPRFGSAAVTMPHKLDALSLMDSLGDEVKEIGSMNTIVVLRNGQLEGRNTDSTGIRNALLSTLPAAQREAEHPWRTETGSPSGASAVVIGGGGATRAAIYALSKMNLSPIYILNRDPLETRAMIDSFPQYQLVALEDEEQWNEEEAEKCKVIVGAIPSMEPQTEGEKMVYRVAEKVFRLGDGKERKFLDMAYKPHVTKMIAIARRHNWITIGGIEALVHQALAQQSYWLLDPRAMTYLPEVAQKGLLNETVFEIAAGEVRSKAGVPSSSVA